MASALAEPRIEDVAPAERALLERAAAVGERLGIRTAWVGGGVRDLLLGRAHPDLDLVAEGDWAALAGALARDLGGRTGPASAFHTTTIELPGGRRLDVAGARSERYARPAALPEVVPAALEADLARRDFSANAMALLLAPAPDRGRLLDPHGGRADLRLGLLRALHAASFADDPTRILRGVRFELRLGLRFEEVTEAAARATLAAGGLEALSGPRLADALEHLFREPVPLDALFGRLADLGFFAAVVPGVAPAAPVATLERTAADVARAAGDGGLDRWRLALAAWAGGAAADGRRRLAARLALPAAERRLVVEEVESAGQARITLARADAAPRDAAACLAGLSREALALVAAPGGPARAWVTRYLRELKSFRLTIGARDLIAAGARPGPALGVALRATLDARLDGRLASGGELAYALERYREAAGR